MEKARRFPLQRFKPTIGRLSSDEPTPVKKRLCCRRKWTPQMLEEFSKILARLPLFANQGCDQEHIFHLLENIREHLNTTYDAQLSFGELNGFILKITAPSSGIFGTTLN